MGTLRMRAMSVVSLGTQLVLGPPATAAVRPPERATATDGQVVLNLTVNVIESMSAVEPRYRKLRLSSEHVERGDISRSILDAGPGIDPDHLNEIFKPLFTIKPQGMGMGLSICRSIIE